MIEFVFFWLPILLLLHTYLVYPVFLKIIGIHKRNNEIIYLHDPELPFLSIIISVYNEEKHIAQRIRNIYLTHYPLDKFEIIVGSDGSTDLTNQLLKGLKNQFPNLRIELFDSRSGKPEVVNKLVNIAVGEVLILTDAKVLFAPQTLFQLAKHFKNKRIGIVGGNIINKTCRTDGISLPENTYMSSEMEIKYNEGKIWRKVIGVYGASYAIRKNLFSPFPKGLTVEDFYSTMQVIENKHEVIMEINALCYENVTNKLQNEFKRKIRISSGNFQNISHFRHLFFQFSTLGFCLVSHKLLRWLGPVFIISILISNAFLLNHNNFYLYTFVSQLFVLTIPLFDFFLHKIRTDIIILRFISHFYLMNLALLIGLFKYIKGVKTNVWEPTKR